MGCEAESSEGEAQPCPAHWPPCSQDGGGMLLGCVCRGDPTCSHQLCGPKPRLPVAEFWRSTVLIPSSP